MFFNGHPNQLTQRITPWQQGNRTRYDGFYVQDQWTRGRVTLQGAVRYEHAWSWFPEGENGIPADTSFNAAPIRFPRTEGVKGYNDITPRMGVAYDVFGNGKTALKANFSKYLQPANNEGDFTIGQPRGHLRTDHRPRSWIDGNGE